MSAPLAGGPLLAEGRADVVITVTIPLAANDGGADTVTVPLASQGDDSVADFSTLLTVAVAPPPTGWYIYLPIVARQ